MTATKEQSIEEKVKIIRTFLPDGWHATQAFGVCMDTLKSTPTYILIYSRRPDLRKLKLTYKERAAVLKPQADTIFQNLTEAGFAVKRDGPIEMVIR
jgi:hypothetical protein